MCQAKESEYISFLRNMEVKELKGSAMTVLFWYKENQSRSCES